MLSKKDIFLIHSLKKKKYRQKYKLFLVEGIKSVRELLKSSFEIEKIFCTQEINTLFDLRKYPYQIIKEEELKKISLVKTPNKILALVRLPDIKEEEDSLDSFTLVLDRIADPGNLGTIIRLAYWFGIYKIYACEHTVDFFNPKVIQSSMGSFTKVDVIYKDLDKLLSKATIPVWGAFVKGESIYDQKEDKSPKILLLGSESKGISKALEKYIDKKITIPPYSSSSIDSLNVSISAAILLGQLRKKI